MNDHGSDMDDDIDDLDDRMMDDLDSGASAGHVPVLPEAVVELLAPARGQTVIDCTIGRGGHARLIMPHLAPGGHLLGLDTDAQNVAFVRENFAQSPIPGVTFDAIHANFADLAGVLEDRGITTVDGLLADLGWASSQIADAARGFSFMHDGPLDMRLDQTQGLTAADLVNSLDERELADILWRYGEERLSRRIAQKITEQRRAKPITNTRQLAEICSAAYGPARHRSRIDPATRTFQALRIAVNDELDRLTSLLSQLPDVLSVGGRAAIISFHSLEDRLVKHAFRDLAAEGRVKILTKKPRLADEAERATNPRSRSAKLRGIERI
jgi:16S rRNA (cytosine1402-N4)-methyltransferase